MEFQRTQFIIGEVLMRNTRKLHFANLHNKREITHKDIQRILDDIILSQGQGVFDVFWGQFCESDTLKTTVRQILEKQAITDKEALHQLITHEFVVKIDGLYKLRVPLFERWIRKFDFYFL